MTVKKEKAGKVTLFDRLDNVPRWVIILSVIIAMVAPILHPIGLPIVVSETSRDAFAGVDETPEGSFVVFHIGYGAGGKPTLQPGAVAVSHHLFNKKLKIIYFADNPIDLDNIYEVFEACKPEEVYGKEYGEDYVVLSLTGPFMSQAQIVLGNLLNSVPKDSEGNDLKDLPMFRDYVETESIGLVIQLTSSSTISEGWVAQAYSMYNRRLVGGWVSMMTSAMIPYYQAGQILGFLDGSKGSADYELLVKHPGDAVMITDILSSTQLLYLAFIVIGNIAFFGKKYVGRGE